jgi:hypothetical protein
MDGAEVGEGQARIRGPGTRRLAAGRFSMDFPVIERPPDEIVHWKYIEEARP